jgi:hypothetical protein
MIAHGNRHGADGRVEVWRGGCRLNISVAAAFVWRCLNGSAMAPFPHPAHRTGHADFPHPACMGLSLSRRLHTIFDVRCHSILLFDPRCKHSSVPPAYFHRRRAQRRSRTALLQRRRRLVLDGREHGGRLPAIGRLAAMMIRGEPAIGRDQSREPRLYSVEPIRGPDHEAVIRFCGQGSEAAGPFSQRHCSHSRMRIAATSDCHRLPSASSAVSCRTLFVLSHSRVLPTPPAAARHRPAPRRS